VGLRRGYRTFCIEPFRMVYEKSCDDGASIFEILFSSRYAPDTLTSACVCPWVLSCWIASSLGRGPSFA
jgi:hypothetical protein